jgi:hypothetical protein
MHSETERYQVRDAAGERKPIEILSGGGLWQAEIFHTFLSPSCRHLVVCHLVVVMPGDRYDEAAPRSEDPRAGFRVRAPDK